MENLWLAGLDPADRERIEPHLEERPFAQGQMLSSTKTTLVGGTFAATHFAAATGGASVRRGSSNAGSVRSGGTSSEGTLAVD